MVHSGAPSGRRVYLDSRWFTRVNLGVHSGSLEFTRAGLEVAGFIRASHSLIVAGFIRFGFGSLGRTKVTPGSFGVRCVHSGAYWGGRVLSRSRGFFLARVQVAGLFIAVRVGSLRST